MITNLNSLISQKVVLTDAKKLFATDYSEAFNSYLPEDAIRIYRAHKDLGDCFVLSPTYRKSLGSVNVHTVLMSSMLPNWKEYPKRNHCFIGTTNEYECSTYMGSGEGNYNNEKRRRYIIFPKNNTNIAVCPIRDMWNSFDNTLKDLFDIASIKAFNDQFIELFASFCYAFNIEADRKYIADLFYLNRTGLIRKLFTEAEKKIIDSSEMPSMSWISSRAKIVRYFYNNIKQGNTFISILDKLLDPEYNLFRITNTNNLKLNTDREIWFDSECLFLDTKLFQYFT